MSTFEGYERLIFVGDWGSTLDDGGLTECLIGCTAFFSIDLASYWILLPGGLPLMPVAPLALGS